MKNQNYDNRDRTRDRGGWKEERKAARNSKALKRGEWKPKGTARHAGKHAK